MPSEAVYVSRGRIVINEAMTHGCRVLACRRPVAFTLIELLVVVAILTLLLSILAPSLGRAKEFTRTVSCSSNLHQLGVAGHAYQQANMCFPPDQQNGNAYTWPVQFNKFTNTRNVFWCPSAPDWLKWDDNTLNKGYGNIAFSYGMDVWGAGDSSYLGWWPRTGMGRKGQEIAMPSNFYWLADSDGGLPADPLGRWDLVIEIHAFDWCVSGWSPICQGYNENPGKRHMERMTNMLYADAHAESLLWDDIFKAELLPKGDPERCHWRRKDNIDNEPHEEYTN